MPLCHEIVPKPGVHSAIWHITETVDDLLASIQLSEEEMARFLTYTNEQRKKQWLAYRNILRHLVPETHPANLLYDNHGKPSLCAAPGFISVSHAGNYAAAVYSREQPVGIDIEQLRDRIERVKNRFLSDRELEAINDENQLEKLYILWGAKEAIYKLHGGPDVDFRNDIYIHPFDYLCNMEGICLATLTTPQYTQDIQVFYRKTGANMVTVAYA
jgi:4'-phosphopantetheinyl transferase